MYIYLHILCIYIHNTTNTHIYTDAYAQVYTTLKHSNLSIFIKYLNVFIIYYGIYLLNIFIYIYVYTHTYTYIETSLLHATIINHQCVSTIFFSIKTLNTMHKHTFYNQQKLIKII